MYWIILKVRPWLFRHRVPPAANDNERRYWRANLIEEKTDG